MYRESKKQWRVPFPFRALADPSRVQLLRGQIYRISPVSLWTDLIKPGDYVYFVDADDLIPWVGGICTECRPIPVAEVTSEMVRSSLFVRTARVASDALKRTDDLKEDASNHMYGQPIMQDHEIASLLGVVVDWVDIPQYNISLE